jgi:hypothetical protein
MPLFWELPALVQKQHTIFNVLRNIVKPTDGFLKIFHLSAQMNGASALAVHSLSRGDIACLELLLKEFIKLLSLQS